MDVNSKFVIDSYNALCDTLFVPINRSERMNTSIEVIVIAIVIYAIVWFLWKRPAVGVVTAESTPWGIAYTVTLGNVEYQSSADGTLWTQGYKSVPFSISGRCRKAVKSARYHNKIETKDGQWPELLASLDPEHRGLIIAGGIEGQRNARNSRLLP